MAFGKVFQFLALCLGLSTAPQVFKRVMALVQSFFSIVLNLALALSARLAHSGVLSRVDFLSLRMFLWLCNSLGIVVDWEMSQLVAHQLPFLPRSPIGLLVSGLLQPGNEATSFSHLAPCFYHEGIFPHFLARVVEDAVLSDSAHSGGAAADAVVPVALHRSWVLLDSEALVRWSSEICQDLFWWWTLEWLELVSSLGRGFSPVALWSDSSYVGWALVSTLFGVPCGP